MFVDVHAHLCDGKYGGDIETYVTAYRNAGVELVINSGYNLPSSELVMQKSQLYSDMYFSAGVHPDDAKTLNKGDIDRLLCVLKDKKCVAVGEIGFDFYWNKSTEEEQIFAFEKQMELADHLSLPFVIHSREASAKTLAFLKDRKSLLKNGFLMHCFSESAEMAKEYQKLGGYFSFGGVITFKNANKGDIIKSVPLDRLLLETDCPYMTPVPNRGKLNEPKFIAHTCSFIANVLDFSEKKLEELTTQNAKRFFGI